MCKRRPKNVAYFIIGRNFNFLINRINKTGNLDRQRRARDIVQTTEVLRATQIKTEFLASLALSRVFEIGIIGFDCTTGKGDMPRPGVCRMRRTLDKKKIETIPSRVQNRSNSRLRFIRFQTRIGLIRR